MQLLYSACQGLPRHPNSNATDLLITTVLQSLRVGTAAPRPRSFRGGAHRRSPCRTETSQRFSIRSERGVVVQDPTSRTWCTVAPEVLENTVGFDGGDQLRPAVKGGTPHPTWTTLPVQLRNQVYPPRTCIRSGLPLQVELSGPPYKPTALDLRWRGEPLRIAHHKHTLRSREARDREWRCPGPLQPREPKAPSHSRSFGFLDPGHEPSTRNDYAV